MLTRKQLLLLLILIGCGFLIALKLFQIDFMVNYSGTPYRSFCNVNATFNCDAVAASQYSHLFGIPIAFIGAYANLLLLVFILVAQRSVVLGPVLRHLLLLIFFLYALGCLVLALISFIFVPSFCLVCLLFWLVSIGTFIYLLTISGEFLASPWLSIGQLGQALWRSKSTVLCFLLLFLGGSLYLRHYLSGLGCKKKSVHTDQCEHFDGQSNTAFLGRNNSKLDVIVYTDFQCPWCRRSHQAVLELAKQFESQVRFIRRDFPLDISCNRAISNPFHPLACQAARFAKCAGLQGKYWQFHDELYRNMEIVSPEIMLNIAGLLGLDERELLSCADSVEIDAKVKSDIEEALRYGVEGTPSFRIYAELFPGIINQEQIREYLAFYPALSPDIVKRIIEKGMASNLQIIDLRRRQQFNQDHIAGAISIPLEELSGELGQLEAAVPLLLYDQDGQQAAQAFDFLVSKGWRDLRFLQGGFANFK